MTNRVTTIVQRVQALATLPTVAAKIMKVADDPNASIARLHGVLNEDPVLAARVLKVVNSAFYRRSQAIASTLTAIHVLGVSSVRSIAVAASLTRLFRGPQAGRLKEIDGLWDHAVAVGVAARALAVRTQVTTPDEAQLAGVLHDLGIVVALQGDFPHFRTVIEQAVAEPARAFRDVEREVMTVDHQQLGAALCEAWNFPPQLVNVCLHHHDPLSLPEEERALPALVHVADVLAAQAGIGLSRTVEHAEPDPEVLALLRLSEGALAAVRDGLAAEVRETMALMAA